MHQPGPCRDRLFIEADHLMRFLQADATLAACLEVERLRQDITQSEQAELLALGITKRQLGKIIA